MSIKNYNKAFTLVELIVTITILAILGTIAFFALQGYSQNSRDSVRISDLSRMKTSLEIFNVEAGKYPEPTNFTPITYSGGTVWYQGTFGESTFTNVEKLDRIPTDPSTNSKYTYSITENKTEFEIGGIVESDDLSSLSLITDSYAGNNLAQAIIVGNYNGKIIKVLSGTTCGILSVPSIIASDLSSSSDLLTILSQKKLAYKGFNNLPDSFKSSKFKYDGGFEFSPNKLVLYSDTGSCNALTNDICLRISLFDNMLYSYSGTIINDLVSIDSGLDIASKLSYSKSIMENILGLNIYDDPSAINDIINTNTCSTSTGSTSTGSSDTTAPLILSSGPSGTTNSSGATLTVTTNENATCKYNSSDVSYDSMTNTFSTTGGTSHSSPYNASVGVNTLYVKCSDFSGNKSLTSNIVFTYVYNAPVNITMSPVSGGTYTCDLCN